MEISLDKKYKTQDGQEVRIYALDGQGHWPVHGAFKDDRGWWSAQWNLKGLYFGNSDPSGLDLVEVQPRIKRDYWLSIFKDGSAYASTNKMAHWDSVIAITKVSVDCEEGEGL